MANSTAILVDAFPVDQRGLAMGINTIAGITGSFVGLIVGGLLADWNWRLVFWVNVPFGVFGAVWAYLKLRETTSRNAARIDWAGNVTFGVGLVVILVAITYGIQPYGGHTMGWTAPIVLVCAVGGVALLAAILVVEKRVGAPMFDLRLFRICAFSAGNGANLLTSVARGGLQFMPIIWLQGIWLPLRGCSFERTPLWAASTCCPSPPASWSPGPPSGWLSDRYGARTFATPGALVVGASLGLLMLLPADFSYVSSRCCCSAASAPGCSPPPTPPPS